MREEVKDTGNFLKDANEVEDTEKEGMAKKIKEGRKGAIKDRVQMFNPHTERWIKIDTETWKIIDQKKTPGPYKGAYCSFPAEHDAITPIQELPRQGLDIYYGRWCLRSYGKCFLPTDIISQIWNQILKKINNM